MKLNVLGGVVNLAGDVVPADKKNHMNYINKLQQEIAELKEQRSLALVHLHDFKMHLCSEKFQGCEGGDRKDWIAVSDVLRVVQQIQSVL